MADAMRTPEPSPAAARGVRLGEDGRQSLLRYPVLVSLAEDGRSAFDSETPAWRCELARISVTSAITDNVVELMVRQSSDVCPVEETRERTGPARLSGK